MTVSVMVTMLNARRTLHLMQSLAAQSKGDVNCQSQRECRSGESHHFARRARLLVNLHRSDQNLARILCDAIDGVK